MDHCRPHPQSVRLADLGGTWEFVFAINSTRWVLLLLLLRVTLWKPLCWPAAPAAAKLALAGKHLSPLSRGTPLSSSLCCIHPDSMTQGFELHLQGKNPVFVFSLQVLIDDHLFWGADNFSSLLFDPLFGLWSEYYCCYHCDFCNSRVFWMVWADPCRWGFIIICSFIHPSIHPRIYLPICSSVHPLIHPALHPASHPPAQPATHPSSHLSSHWNSHSVSHPAIIHPFTYPALQPFTQHHMLSGWTS